MTHKLVGKIYSGTDISWRSEEILEELKVGFCKICGFHHAYPYPSAEFLAEYYQVYEIPIPLCSEERDRIARMIASKISTAGGIIDVGCGKGELLEVLAKYGFSNLYGSEFGSMRSDSCKLRTDIPILPYDIPGLCRWCKQESKIFDCVILINVLEHVPDPIVLMRQLKDIISPQGLLMFCVPNDFNPLQMVYLEKTEVKPWFLVLPDHVNYFSLETIDVVMEKAGYEIVDKSCQYPLELFLLQGDDYVERPEVGKICHRKRLEFEKSFMKVGQADLLEKIYKGFSQLGIGRDLYIFAKPLAR
jgi:SAM-dependent methyltransferase